eukprot:TRINITY_DN16084_c0_g1_i1.p1 TRINITY_DN16084_c0_g1~~TRINITY_DN16084_c0_g1_i1.p1  ORF type:complete len:257 (+),score=42.72 TRINITY_DN16084_c0_g1_i1:92-772(+)
MAAAAEYKGASQMVRCLGESDYTQYSDNEHVLAFLCKYNEASLSYSMPLVVRSALQQKHVDDKDRASSVSTAESDCRPCDEQDGGLDEESVVSIGDSMTDEDLEIEEWLMQRADAVPTCSSLPEMHPAIRGMAAAMGKHGEVPKACEPGRGSAELSKCVAFDSEKLLTAWSAAFTTSSSSATCDTVVEDKDAGAAKEDHRAAIRASLKLCSLGTVMAAGFYIGSRM